MVFVAVFGGEKSMIYPNGTVELRKLIDMVNSEDYAVYVEDRKDEPEDWNWREKGIWRGTLTSIRNREDLDKWIVPILHGEVNLCYDLTPEYTRKHPCSGESFTYVKPTFVFEYSGKANWAIKETDTYYNSNGERVKGTTLELLKYEGEFNSTCFVVGSWNLDKEGYEFRSIGDRIFQYIDLEDLPTIWKGLVAADTYLNRRDS